jgi:hypothetical protein
VYVIVTDEALFFRECNGGFLKGQFVKINIHFELITKVYQVPSVRPLIVFEKLELLSGMWSLDEYFLKAYNFK